MNHENLYVICFPRKLTARIVDTQKWWCLFKIISFQIWAMFGIFVKISGGWFPPIPENNSVFIVFVGEGERKNPRFFGGRKKSWRCGLCIYFIGGLGTWERTLEWRNGYIFWAPKVCEMYCLFLKDLVTENARISKKWWCWILDF